MSWWRPEICIIWISPKHLCWADDENMPIHVGHGGRTGFEGATPHHRVAFKPNPLTTPLQDNTDPSAFTSHTVSRTGVLSYLCAIISLSTQEDDKVDQTEMALLQEEDAAERDARLRHAPSLCRHSSECHFYLFWWGGSLLIVAKYRYGYYYVLPLTTPQIISTTSANIPNTILTSLTCNLCTVTFGNYNVSLASNINSWRY